MAVAVRNPHHLKDSLAILQYSFATFEVADIKLLRIFEDLEMFVWHANQIFIRKFDTHKNFQKDFF